ncbi:MAG TPA: hypothetical protein VKP30_21200 [Polyangiaceae bacterium]|nr:hypothetical protein [Polyangiaceae bacterium]
MQRIDPATTLTVSVVLSAAAMLLIACNDSATGTAPESGVGGATTNDSQDQNANGKGGGSTSSKASSKASKGGASSGTRLAEEGGSSPRASGGSSTAKGGSTAKSVATSSTKAAGGTKASGGTGSRTATGASSAKGGAPAQGGSSGKVSSSSGGSSSTGTSSSSPVASTCTPEEEKFSFFLASQNALVQASGNADGFGGDLGGITGADAICQKIAETSAPCHKGKVVWHAFLSTSSANARDRIGKGPWYDRRGRLLAKTLTDLINERPIGADSSIAADFPNENGVPNHSPDGKLVDNHQIITGSGTDGNVYKQAASGSTGGGMPGGGFGGSLAQDACLETWSVEAATCKGWTTNEAEGCPRVGPAGQGVRRGAPIAHARSAQAVGTVVSIVLRSPANNAHRRRGLSREARGFIARFRGDEPRSARSRTRELGVSCSFVDAVGSDLHVAIHKRETRSEFAGESLEAVNIRHFSLNCASCRAFPSGDTQPMCSHNQTA